MASTCLASLERWLLERLLQGGGFTRVATSQAIAPLIAEANSLSHQTTSTGDISSERR